MKTIQIVLDEDLLRAADKAAERARLNRSALMREALRSYLRGLRRQELESLDRAGYERRPDQTELSVWEGEASWPEE